MYDWGTLDSEEEIHKWDSRYGLVIVGLTEMHLAIHGGYPYGWTWVGDVLVIASLDDGKDRLRTEIATYKAADVAAWNIRAAEYLAGDSDAVLWEAVYETEQGEELCEP